MKLSCASVALGNSIDKPKSNKTTRININEIPGYINVLTINTLRYTFSPKTVFKEMEKLFINL